MYGRFRILINETKTSMQCLNMYQNGICHKKPVPPAGCHLHGARNGKRFGMMLNIVPNDVETRVGRKHYQAKLER